MERPRNIILLVADSLRYDSVHRGGDPRLPYTSGHAVDFTQARSGGCWTLPATGSLFTGLMPHEHGADSQTRGLSPEVPTLAERMKARGFRTHQITANIATTEIFGLDRGFDEVFRVWKEVPAHYRKVHEVMILIGKPRLRKKILTPDFVQGKLTEDLEASKVWLQTTADDVFDTARKRLTTNERAGKPSFLFLNLMETHFPYHVADTFETTAEGVVGKMREVYSLFHLINQTWLTTGRQPIRDDMMQLIRERQRTAWLLIAAKVDAFVKEMHQQGNLVVFCSDHGDNFGEQGWVYHFSNVTDAGNRVPLYWLDGTESPRTVDTPVSARDVFHALLTRIGDTDARFDLLREPERSMPVMQSCWYNNQGKTLDKFRFNQICLLEGGTRWLRRRNEWLSSPPANDEGVEAPFVRLAPGVDPVEEVVLPERRAEVRKILRDFHDYSERVEG